MQNVKMFVLLYVNSITQKAIINNMAKKMCSCLLYLNNDSTNKLGKTISFCEFCCVRIIWFLDYSVNTVVTSVANTITASLEQKLVEKGQISVPVYVPQQPIRHQFRATTSVREYQTYRNNGDSNNSDNLDEEPMTVEQILSLREKNQHYSAINDIPNLNILGQDSINEILKQGNQSKILNAIDNEFAMLGDLHNDLN